LRTLACASDVMNNGGCFQVSELVFGYKDCLVIKTLVTQSQSTGLKHAHPYSRNLRYLHGKPGNPGASAGASGDGLRPGGVSAYEHSTAGAGDRVNGRL